MIQEADIGDPTGLQCSLTPTAYTYVRSSLRIFTVRSRHASTLTHYRCFFSQVTEGCRDGNIFFYLRAFVCDIAPHANLQIIESQGNNSRRLFCPLTTPVVAADAVILLKSTLAATQMRQREKTPSGKHPQGTSPWTSGQSGSCGRFNNYYCSACSRCVQVQVQFRCLYFYVRSLW